MKLSNAEFIIKLKSYLKTDLCGDIIMPGDFLILKSIYDKLLDNEMKVPLSEYLEPSYYDDSGTMYDHSDIFDKKIFHRSADDNSVKLSLFLKHNITARLESLVRLIDYFIKNKNDEPTIFVCNFSHACGNVPSTLDTIGMRFISPFKIVHDDFIQKIKMTISKNLIPKFIEKSFMNEDGNENENEIVDEFLNEICRIAGVRRSKIHDEDDHWWFNFSDCVFYRIDMKLKRREMEIFRHLSCKSSFHELKIVSCGKQFSYDDFGDALNEFYATKNRDGRSLEIFIEYEKNGHLRKVYFYKYNTIKEK